MLRVKLETKTKSFIGTNPHADLRDSVCDPQQ